MICAFCNQHHDEVAPGPFPGLVMVLCPNIPETWVFVEGDNGDGVVYETDSEEAGHGGN
jgi:hypothetical protein